MAGLIKSKYGPYKFAAALITNLKRNPLELLIDPRLSSLRGVQFCSPDIVVSERQLVAAFAAAATTTLSGIARSKRVEMEFLLRLSAQTQIQDAFKTVGLRGDEESVVAVAITSGDEEPEQQIIRVIELLGGSLESAWRTFSRDKVMEVYGISPDELRSVPESESVETLELLVLERIVSSYVS